MFKIFSNVKKTQIGKNYTKNILSYSDMHKHLIHRTQMYSFHKKVHDRPSADKKESQAPVQKASMKSVYKYLKPYLKKENTAKLLIFSVVLTVASKGLVSLAPYFLKLTINSVLEKSYISTPIIFLIISGLCRVLGIGVQEIRQIILTKVSSRIMVNFSKDMMNYLMKIEFSQFKHNSENVMNQFTRSLQGLERLNRFVIGSLMSNIIEMGIVSIMLYLFVGPKYFLTTMVTYVLYSTVTRRMSFKRQVDIRSKYKADLGSQNKLFDIIYNIDTVKYFQREGKEAENYANIIKGVRNKDEKVISSLAVLNTCQTLIISFGMALNMTLGIYDCFNGTMTPGDLVMLQAIFAQIMLPLNFMGTLMREVEDTRVNLQYAVDMINEKDKMNENSKNLKLFHFQGGLIEFKDVTFGFKGLPQPQEKTQHNNRENKDLTNVNAHSTHHQPKLILNNANVTFEKNTMNAIVGFSGQGKSTLFHLLYKFYDPIQGKILMDGQDISQVDADSYRKHLSICPQNGHLFNDSLLYNIRYGNLDSSQEEIENILKDVNLYNKIMALEDKFNTNVGSLGSKLSGGERQRLLLARAFIKKSDILLLDEPTSNLDNYNENKILEYLRSQRQSKTILISAHKLSTITHCDNIYVLNKGSFVEVGDHQTLMNRKGLYYEMFTKHIFKE